MWGLWGILRARFRAASLRSAISLSLSWSSFMKKPKPWQSTLEQYPEFVQAIGMISVENANLEIALADLLARALAIPRHIAHAIYFTPRASALRIEIMEGAVAARLRVRNPDRKPPHRLDVQMATAAEKVGRLAKRAYGVVQRRHDTIHDAWAVLPDEDGETVVRQKVGKTLSKEHKKESIQALNDLVRDFRVLIDEVHQLAAEFLAHPPFMADLRSSSTKGALSALTESDVKPASRK